MIKKNEIKSFMICSLLIAFWVIFILAILFFPQKSFLSQKNVLNIFTWGDMFDPLYLKKFEEETGIKINMSYYSSNEELLVKLKATEGKGYDLIFPSDYATKQLIEENLLKPLDKEQLDFLSFLNPHLLDLHFDPSNRYSIPFEWEVFGLGIDTTFFKEGTFVPSWDLIFKKPSYHIAMINDPLEAVSFADSYLYKTNNIVTPEQVKAIKNLLIQQKTWVEAYVDFRGDYFLATKNCPVTVASSSYIIRSIKEYPFIDFVLPQEGIFVTIESLAIPKNSTKDTLIYTFINFLYRRETMLYHFEKLGLFPSRLDVLTTISTNPKLKVLIDKVLDKNNTYYFFHKIMPNYQLRDLWITIKAS